jgi:hypothetical protein
MNNSKLKVRRWGKGIFNLIACGLPNKGLHLVAELKSIAGDEFLANVEDLEFRA